VIHPCKACVSTSMALCHWPCSCYPNHAMGQTNDWMAEIYPRWVAAHGVLVLCPVHWYQAPASLKLMMDRLVCADGGNPDPTTTRGKDPAAAKALELAGWPYPRHLAGRAFAVVAHGDSQGHEGVREALSEWLTSIGMIQAGRPGRGRHPDRLLGALRHQPRQARRPARDLRQVENAAKSLARLVRDIRSGPIARRTRAKESAPKVGHNFRHQGEHNGIAR
jgi:multimeric flavodoxin WrbA